MAWGCPGTHGTMRHHSTLRSPNTAKESCQVTGHPSIVCLRWAPTQALRIWMEKMD